MKWTSGAAYDANKKFQPNMRWDILRVLADNKWRTSQQVHADVGRGELGSVKSRLRELELTGCVVTRDVGAKTRSNAEAMSYQITRLGGELLSEPHLGKFVNQEIGRYISKLNDDRADALKAHKKHWRDREEAEIPAIFDALMTKHIRPF